MLTAITLIPFILFKYIFNFYSDTMPDKHFLYQIVYTPHDQNNLSILK